ncbi:MAG TPA: DUF3883 domain-containing protein [Kiritimatiellia bacterium]|nr:DUF3883 domain-containing protein [Kiritimatiellia bacterium]
MKIESNRDKLILAGLFLSKFDDEGLKTLGFAGFTEAFNAISIGLSSSPASLKNYRDEFDPYFPNPRKGWHKRSLRPYCRAIMEQFRGLDLDNFAELLKSQIYRLGELESFEEKLSSDVPGAFARRLITGQAAEKYFEAVYTTASPFHSCRLENTTGLGCGFDFRLQPDSAPYYAVEVKGLASASGAIQMTDKEYKVAAWLKDRFFLFVVRNFAEKPFHTLFRDPIHSDLTLERRERVTVQVSWTASIGSA